jgi:hypothetical protein
MARPHTLPSSAAREEGCFSMNAIATIPAAKEGGITQYHLSKNEHGLLNRSTGILELDHCFISLSLQGGDNV